MREFFESKNAYYFAIRKGLKVGNTIKFDYVCDKAPMLVFFKNEPL